MKRIFAFDPGTAALGWAVIETDGETTWIRACGVRLYALTRQRIVETMKQRLKPEDRVKARQRRRMRLKKLRELLHSIGLADAREEPHWKTSDGLELERLFQGPLATQISRRLLVRIVFNVHHRRGGLTFGPEGKPARSFLEDLLLAQAGWHPVLTDETIRSQIVAAVFHRRNTERRDNPAPQVSRLARLASDELMAVWQALTAEFGPAGLTVIEAAVPRQSSRAAKGAGDDMALKLLESRGLKATPRKSLKARLFVRQSLQGDELAQCSLTGEPISFDAAMSAAVEVDHVLPMAHGGKGGRSNLQLVMANANRAKGAGNAFTIATPLNPVSIADADALRQSLRLLRDHFHAFAVPANHSFLPSRKIATMRNRMIASTGVKDRSSLRHHAHDAICAGLVPIFGGDGDLPDGITASIVAALAKARLSVRAERSTKGRMHDDTRYGLTSPGSSFDPKTHIAVRKPVESLTPAMMAKIADSELRQKALSAGIAAAPKITETFGRTRRVRIAQPASGHIRLMAQDGTFRAAVLPSDNHHMDIVQMRDGQWKAFTVTRHERRQPGWRPVWEVNHMGGKLVMRLHKGDMVEWQSDDGSREMLVVARLSGSSGILHFNRPWADSGSVSLVAAAASTLKRKQAKAVVANAGGRTRFRRTNAA